MKQNTPELGANYGGEDPSLSAEKFPLGNNFIML